MANWSAHADKQQQVAASRRVLPAGDLQRYASSFTCSVANG